MFYLGFSSHCTTELFLVVFFSFFSYLFYAKKEDFWRITKIRPSHDDHSVADDIFEDLSQGSEAFYSIYGDRIEQIDLYAHIFFEPDAEEMFVEELDYYSRHNKSRIELRKFLDNEVTERWSRIYTLKFFNFREAWVS